MHQKRGWGCISLSRFTVLNEKEIDAADGVETAHMHLQLGHPVNIAPLLGYRVW